MGTPALSAIALERETVVPVPVATDPGADSVAQRAIDGLMRTADRVAASLTGTLAAHGLSSGRFALLMALSGARSAGLTPSDLADRIGVSRANVTGLLDGLQRDGLVIRQPHESDRRRLIVTLTAQGEARLADVMPPHRDNLERLVSVLSPEEQDTFLRLLTKLSDGATALEDRMLPRRDR